jgi:hypothetical protein
LLDFLLMLALFLLRPAGGAPAGVPCPAVAAVGTIAPADARPLPLPVTPARVYGRGFRLRPSVGPTWVPGAGAAARPRTERAICP